MSDLADRLDALSQEATRAVSFLPLELAAVARRRRRNRLRAGLAGLGCAAALALVVALVPGHSNVVRVVTTPSSKPSPTTVSGGASPPTDVWDRIAAVAHNTAIEFGDPSPKGAEAVATDLQAYERATGGGSTPNDATTQVYFVAMTGSFTCGPACFNVSGHTPKGSVLSIALDRSTLAANSVSVTNQPVGLDLLGTVHQLDLSQTSTVTGRSAPRQGGSSYAGPIPRAVTYSETGISLTVPPAAAKPGVTWQTALDNCFTSGGICSPDLPATVSLAVATDRQAGQGPPNGSIAPVMDNTLVFVVAQSGEPCVSSGPPGSSQNTAQTSSCTILDFFRADTGAEAYAVSGPAVWDPSQPAPTNS